MEKLVAVDIKKLKLPYEFRVKREMIIGANKFGRPISEEKDQEIFSNFDAALDWVIKSPEYSHYFEVPLPSLAMSASLEKERSPYSLDPQNEWINVACGQRKGRSPRGVEKHHAVQTNYETYLNLIINLDLNQRSLFDRGVVWVNPKEDYSSTLMFIINAGVHTKEELEEAIAQMVQRVDLVINDLLNGMPANQKDLTPRLKTH